MQDATRKMISLALRADDSVTPSRKREIERFLCDGKQERVPIGKARKILGVSRTTFWRRVKSGQWPLNKIVDSRKAVFVLASELDGLVEVNNKRGAE